MSKLQLVTQLMKQIPIYYESINLKDPLVAILFSVTGTIAVSLIAFRRKPLAQLFILLVNMIIIHNTRRIHIYLSDNQPQLLLNQMISQNYFEDEGKFVLFILTLPIFIVSMLSSINLIYLVIKETKNVHKEIELINQDRKKQNTEKTD
eukprot:EST48423.1 Transmembrane domain-containing protein [Spironucleus salmonicida]